MKRLFILFLVAIMLAGCGRKSIVGHDIDGQDVPIPQQTQQAREKTEEKAEEGTNSVVDSVEQNIEGQDIPIQQQAKEKTEEETKEKAEEESEEEEEEEEEEPARKWQIEKIIVDGINRHNIIYGTGMIVVGAAALKKFQGPRIEYASIAVLSLGLITVAGRLSL